MLRVDMGTARSTLPGFFFHGYQNFGSVSVWASLNLIDSPFGRALRALHGSEVASQVVGVDVVRYKVAIFVLSAVFASSMGRFWTVSSSLVATT